MTFNDEEYYVLTYSCNFFACELYGVGISFSKDPLTLFTKYDRNPIIKENPSNSLYSTGHGCLVEMNNEYYYFFHGRETKEEDRVLYVGKLHLDDIDNIRVTDIKQCKLV
jgi:beta-xylosidase